MKFYKIAALFGAAFVLWGCTDTTPETVIPAADPSLKLTPVSFASLDGWNDDTLDNFKTAMMKSCNLIMKRLASKPVGKIDLAGTNGDWQPFCKNLQTGNAKTAIETMLQPYRVSAGIKSDGLFTGYYEASLKGSRTRTDRYNIPLYKRPADLVMVQLGEFRDALKGQRIAGRVVNGKLKPYESRTEIVNGNWPHNNNVLVWVDDAVDAFFVQIQGSGIVELTDGGIMRIGYDGQNGHSYYAIGRELIKRGHLTKDTVSMQSIRQYLSENPDQADEIMNTNASYVFFKNTGKDGAIGGQGVSLTPLRSLAIDSSKIPYGLPVWLETNNPDLKRLMVTQDTGGAIRGAVRGDIFWGYGDEAETNAGAMKARGQYYLLMPK